MAVCVLYIVYVRTSSIEWGRATIWRVGGQWQVKRMGRLKIPSCMKNNKLQSISASFVPTAGEDRRIFINGAGPQLQGTLDSINSFSNHSAVKPQLQAAGILRQAGLEGALFFSSLPRGTQRPRVLVKGLSRLEMMIYDVNCLPLAPDMKWERAGTQEQGHTC